MSLFIKLPLYIFSKFGRMVLWKIILSVLLQFTETQWYGLMYQAFLIIVFLCFFISWIFRTKICPPIFFLIGHRLREYLKFINSTISHPYNLLIEPTIRASKYCPLYLRITVGIGVSINVGSQLLIIYCIIFVSSVLSWRVPYILWFAELSIKQKPYK